MKFKKFSLLLLIPMILTGCKEDSKAPESKNTPEKGVVKVEMESLFNTKEKSYNLKFNYDNSYFLHDTTDYDNGLMRLSFSNTLASSDKEIAKTYYETMFFEDVHSYGYDDPITADSVAYTFAKKDLGEFVVVGVSIRCYNYGAEWANNLTIGGSDKLYHEGFEARANEIHASLTNYIETIQAENIRIWFSGYSRGGGIALVLTDMLVRQEGYYTSHIYTYTFEAPAMIKFESAMHYNNVFNMTNRYDLIANIPPKDQYGMSRFAAVIDIYNENLPKYLKKLNKQIVLPTFAPKQGKFADPGEFMTWFISEITRVDESYPDDTLATRDEYASRYQEGLSYLIGLYFTLPQETITHIINKVYEYMADNEKIQELLACLFMEDALYNFLYPVLDEDQRVTYDPTSLKNATNLFYRFIRSHTDLVGSFVDVFGVSKIKQDMVNNVLYLVNMHYPEVIYSLIMNQDFVDPSGN